MQAMNRNYSLRAIIIIKEWERKCAGKELAESERILERAEEALKTLTDEKNRLVSCAAAVTSSIYSPFSDNLIHAGKLTDTMHFVNELQSKIREKDIVMVRQVNNKNDTECIVQQQREKTKAVLIEEKKYRLHWQAWLARMLQSSNQLEQMKEQDICSAYAARKNSDE
jgi:PHD/YefM family antitoxin component YafN of YafNO toxin-antitoxin module